MGQLEVNFGTTACQSFAPAGFVVISTRERMSLVQLARCALTAGRSAFRLARVSVPLVRTYSLALPHRIHLYRPTPLFRTSLSARYSTNVSAEVTKEEPATSAEEPGEAIPEDEPTPSASLKSLNGKLAKALAQGNYNEVFAVCKQIKEQKLTPNIFTYNGLIKALTNTYSLEEALKVYRELRANNIQPQLFTFNTLLKAFTKAGNVAMSEQLFGELQKAALKPSPQSYTSMIHLYLQGGDLSKAFALLDKMRTDKFSVSPLVFASLLNASLRMRDSLRTFEVMTMMDKARLEISAQILYQGMILMAKQDEINGALFTFNALKRSGKQLDEGTLTLLLDAAARTARADLAQEIWPYMKSTLKVVPSHAYTSMIYANAKTDRFKEAFELCAEMEKAGYTVHASAMQVLVDMIAVSPEQLDRVYFILVDMKTAGLPVTLDAANAVIMACSKIEEVDRAFATFGELERTFGLKPNVYSFNALLRGCASTGKVNSAFRCLEEIQKAGLKPDARTYTSLIHTCILDQNVTRGLSLMKQMREDGLTPPAQAFSSLIYACARRGLEAPAKELYTEMKSLGYYVSPGIVTEVELIGNPTEARRLREERKELSKQRFQSSQAHKAKVEQKQQRETQQQQQQLQDEQ